MGCSPSKSSHSHKTKTTTPAIDPHSKRNVNRTTSHGPNELLLSDDVVQSGSAQNFNNQSNSDDSETSSVAEKQFFCGTDVSVEWLMQKLCEKYKTPPIPAPQHIIEKLNKYIEKDLDRTLVLRVTFGWEHEVLPRSVVLKICSKQTREDQSPAGKLSVKMFFRECHVYEWLQKQKKASVPKIFLIHKTPTEECNESVIIMEDIAERAVNIEWEDEISVEAVRDLLRLLAQIHAASRQQKSEWTTVITPNNAQFYRQLSMFIGNAATAWTNLDDERLSKLLELTDSRYLAKTVNLAAKKMNCEVCLIHGNPIARNFFLTNRREVAAIIDWTQVHPGCFGEDVAKAICWNLTEKERKANLKKLLEYYHFSLLKYSEGSANDVTMECVERTYNFFLPMAAVTYLMFLPEDLKMASPYLLERAQSLINDSLEMVAGIAPLATLNDVETEDIEYPVDEEPEKPDDLTRTIVKPE
ncbi:CHK domain-containing protein [Aphelenchoides besseyi]|nr:CHK domain-containing protein [Aphelenchoides besseyi]